MYAGVGERVILERKVGEFVEVERKKEGSSQSSPK